MTETEKDSLANKILSSLMGLLAEHHGVKIEYKIITKKDGEEACSIQMTR